MRAHLHTRHCAHDQFDHMSTLAVYRLWPACAHTFCVIQINMTSCPARGQRCSICWTTEMARTGTQCCEWRICGNCRCLCSKSRDKVVVFPLIDFCDVFFVKSCQAKFPTVRLGKKIHRQTGCHFANGMSRLSGGDTGGVHRWNHAL